MVVPLPKCTKVPRVIGVLDASEGAANLQWLAICRFWYPKLIYGFIVCKMHDKLYIFILLTLLLLIIIITIIYYCMNCYITMLVNHDKPKSCVRGWPLSLSRNLFSVHPMVSRSSIVAMQWWKKKAVRNYGCIHIHVISMFILQRSSSATTWVFHLSCVRKPLVGWSTSEFWWKHLVEWEFFTMFHQKNRFLLATIHVAPLTHEA